MNSPAYIISQACISPQETFGHDSFLMSETFLSQVPRRAVEPEYKDYISRKYLRRMGRMVRMGVSAARKVLDGAQLDNPDAILVGTGMGCLRDTEEFLTSIYQSGENIASPNQFIQSTHNNVAAQIAIMLGCYNYNFTYVHRGFSFETALLDALLHIKEREAKETNILVGASDELTDMYLQVTSKFNFWKPKRVDSMSQNGAQNGYEQGEGAAFFVLSNVIKPNTVACLHGLQMVYKPKTESALESQLKAFLVQQAIRETDIDLVLVGFDGANDDKSLFQRVIHRTFSDHPMAGFKHLCGEYKTSGAFGLWLAAEIIQKQLIPDFIKLNAHHSSSIRRVLICNNYNNANYTFSLLSHV